METTFAIIKPDAVEAGHVGEIITVTERNGFNIAALDVHTIDHIDAEKLYAEHKGKFFYDDLVAFITSGPSVLLALEAANAIARWRSVMGATDANKAEPDTIRYYWGSRDTKTMYRNCVHGSDSPEAAKRELALFFSFFS